MEIIRKGSWKNYSRHIFLEGRAWEKKKKDFGRKRKTRGKTEEDKERNRNGGGL